MYKKQNGRISMCSACHQETEQKVNDFRLDENN